MTLGAPLLILLLAVPALCGVAALRTLRIGFGADRLAYGGWAWTLGGGLVALITFAWHLAGKPISGSLLAPVLAAVAGLCLWVLRHREMGVAPEGDTSPRWERVLLGLTITAIALLSLVRILAFNAEPVLVGDEANIFAHKARAMFSSEWIDREYGTRQGMLGVIHADYPLFNPMLHAWVYAAAGRPTLVDNRLPVQLFSLAMLLVLAGGLRSRFRPPVVAGLLLAFFGSAITMENIGPSHADLMLSVCLLITVDAWLRWEGQGSVAWWRLCCCGLAATLWAKNEGSMLVLAFAIGVVAARRWAPNLRVWPELKRQRLWLLLPIGIVALQIGFNAWIGVRNDLFDPRLTGQSIVGRFFSQLGERWWMVVSYYWQIVISEPRWFRWLLPIMIAVVALRPRDFLHSRVLVPVATVLIALVAYQLIFISSPYHGHPSSNETDWHLQTAAARTVLHVLPIAVLGLGMAAAAIAPRIARR